MRLYKWLLPDMRTSVQRKPWPVAVGEWTPAENPVLCVSGWHGMYEKDVLKHLPHQLGSQLWVVEARGIVKGGDKFVARKMRLVEHIGTTDETNLRLFACDVAEDVLDIFEAKYPNDQRPRNAIEVARRFALGEATRAELDAARADAGAARADARAAQPAQQPARAAWAAAWAAWDAAWAARDARATAEAAAGVRYSNWLVVRLESGY